MGQPMIVLNDYKIAAELLDRRAGIYSDRPAMIVASEILSDGLLLSITRYGETYVHLSLSLFPEVQETQVAAHAQSVA